jgi:hypothetical protein
MGLLAFLTWLTLVTSEPVVVSEVVVPVNPISPPKAVVKTEMLLSAPEKIREAEKYQKRAGNNPCDGYAVFLDLQPLRFTVKSPYLEMLSEKVGGKLGGEIVALGMRSKCLNKKKEEWADRLVSIANSLAYARIPNGNFPQGLEAELLKIFGEWKVSEKDQEYLAQYLRGEIPPSPQELIADTKKKKEEKKAADLKKKKDPSAMASAQAGEPTDPILDLKLSNEQQKALELARKGLLAGVSYITTPDFCKAGQIRRDMMNARSIYEHIGRDRMERLQITEMRYWVLAGVTPGDLQSIPENIGRTTGLLLVKILHEEIPKPVCAEPFLVLEELRSWAVWTALLRDEYQYRFTEHAPSTDPRKLLEIWGATEEDLKRMFGPVLRPTRGE